MTADTAVLERALTVMAICMSVQTLLCIVASVAAFVTWRRATAALTEAKVKADRQVDLLRGTNAVDDVVSDVRDAMGTVRNSVGSVASMVTAPRAALALGLWRGLQGWRKRRAVERPVQVQKPSQAQKPAPVQKPATLRT